MDSPTPPSSRFRLFTRGLSARTTTTRPSMVPPMSPKTIRAVKLRLLEKNPAIYQHFQDRVNGNVYTHQGVAHHLECFLEQDFRVPELQNEIHAYREQVTGSSSGTRLLSYLKGDSELSPGRRKRLKSRSPETQKVKVELLTESLAPSLPSLSPSDDCSESGASSSIETVGSLASTNTYERFAI